MDVLKEKAQKTFDYTSRYASFAYYYNSNDKKYIYELGNQLKTDKSYVTVKVTEATTLDALANKYYGRPDYFWIIADFNRISDPFINLIDYYSEIKIPSIAELEYKET